MSLITVNPFEESTSARQRVKYGCTVVSLIPYAIQEEKPHMLPGTFRIPAAEYGDIEIIHVEEGTCIIPNPFVEEGRSNSSYKQITMPAEMARSICEDYKCAHIGLSENAEPGLFWIDGKYTKDEVKQNFKFEISEAKKKQDNWFRNMIALADADWMKNHNIMAVSDLQRIAARSLGVNKDWIEVRIEETVSCPFCKIAVNPSAVKCFSCGEVINKDRYEKMKEER